MIQPPELKKNHPVSIANGVKTTTAEVWRVLAASYEGRLAEVKLMASTCPEITYAQYNYTPPIHFAVREGHLPLVKYLLDIGAHDPKYRIYPFQDSLLTIAKDRDHHEIVELLEIYGENPSLPKFTGDNGEIHYERTAEEIEFQQAVDRQDLETTARLLKSNTGLALDNSFFWGEGILLFAAKENNRPMIDLLMSYGATVPNILKWAQFYYFERLDAAAYLMEKGMNPNVMSWQHVTLLHDMAQKGNIPKAELLLKYGAGLDTVEEEYQSTPLGMAARWGHSEMVKYLLGRCANSHLSGAAWSTPLAWARRRGFAEIEKLLFDAGAR